MLTPKNILLNENDYEEYPIGSYNDITITIQCYDSIKGIDPYIRIFKDIFNPIKQRFCRLSLLESKYICLYDETLELTKEDINNINYIIKFAGMNKIDKDNATEESGWKQILSRFINIVVEEKGYQDDTYNSDLIDNNYFINDINYINFIKPDYYKLLDKSNIIHHNNNLYEVAINKYYGWLSKLDNNLIDDRNIELFVDISLKYPNIVCKYGIINLNTFTSNFDKDITNYIISNFNFIPTINKILSNDLYNYIKFDIYDTAMMFYYSKKGIDFNDIKFSIINKSYE